ncbi:hypothetical protein [Adlercreutzia shanghongiae]|uniref:Uncharacterized protein n=1 Tax=Adlercreutzia shanghongiae TaxID=3111773 RepID=A0ABU6IW21_9ACTN|nr:hypothetical protein [Adlercreutzia sp. R22]MEC4294026.1 hypothetical protein [Adlercreutzia sp. R22]
MGEFIFEAVRSGFGYSESFSVTRFTGEELVRCAKCRHYSNGGCFVRKTFPVRVPIDGFCHLGERWKTTKGNGK